MQPEEDASSYLYGSTNYLAPNLAEVDQDGIAPWLALWLATEEVLGSNPSKGDNLSISGYLIYSNLNTTIVWVYELTGQV